jgi:hypothetical protein
MTHLFHAGPSSFLLHDESSTGLGLLLSLTRGKKEELQMRDRRFMSQQKNETLTKLFDSHILGVFRGVDGCCWPCVEPETSKRIPSLSVFLSRVCTRFGKQKSVKRNGFPRLRISSTSSASSFSIFLGLDGSFPGWLYSSSRDDDECCPPFGNDYTMTNRQSKCSNLVLHVICQTRTFR